jgi:RNA polymerase sigma factor (sigma-70 family)
MIDWQLLQRYVQTGSPEAFEALAQRHVDWIYAAAKRQVRDPHLASDVTQAVFLVLARKAATIPEGASLSGWLFRTTRYCAMDAKKMDARRRYHERHAATERAEAIELESIEWRDVTPQLDESVASLKQADREAIVRRFYRDQSLSDIGQAMGVSEEAAKKRVSRAVEKLRKALARRGVRNISAVAIASGLNVAIAENAPAQVLQSVSGVAGNASVAASQIATGAMKMMFYAKLKLVALVTLLVLIAPTLAIYLHGATASDEASTTKTAHWPDAPPATGGPVLVCVWEAVVQQATADKIKSDSEEITKLKDGASVAAVSSDKLMDTLVQAKADNGVAGILSRLSWLDHSDHTTAFTRAGHLEVDPSNDPRRAPDVFSGTGGGFYEMSQVKDTARLHFKGSINVHLSKGVNADFEFSRDLRHGDCVVAFAPVGATPKWGDLCELLIFQAAQTSADDTAWVRKMIDAPRWFEIGLDGALRLAKDVADWDRNAGTSSPEVIKRWTHELTNGAKIRLVGVGKLGEMTYRFWDPEGTPLKTEEGWVGVSAPDSRPAEMLAVVEFTLPKATSDREKQFAGNRMVITGEISEGSGPLSIDAGICGGTWKNIGAIEQGETSEVAGGTFKLTEVKPFTERRGSFPGRIVVVADYTDLPDVQFSLAAIDKDGKQQSADDDYGQKIGRPEGAMSRMPAQVPVGMSELDHLVLRTRERQWTKFENVAKEPTLGK